MKSDIEFYSSRLPRLYETEDIPEEEKLVPLVFVSDAGWKWYPVEFDPDDHLFFGLVEGWEEEWGYFSLDELEEVHLSVSPLRIHIFETPQTLAEVRKTLNKKEELL